MGMSYYKAQQKQIGFLSLCKSYLDATQAQLYNLPLSVFYSWLCDARAMGLILLSSLKNEFTHLCKYQTTQKKQTESCAPGPLILHQQ